VQGKKIFRFSRQRTCKFCASC